MNYIIILLIALIIISALIAIKYVIYHYEQIQTAYGEKMYKIGFADGVSEISHKMTSMAEQNVNIKDAAQSIASTANTLTKITS